jgi:tRNA pseudouridine55 synthase
MRRALKFKRIGHSGTLDPLATGVLVLCLGAYTRLSPWLSRGGKEYTSRFSLGATSDSGDACGNIESSGVSFEPPIAAIEDALTAFRGSIDQMPPVYSAIKINGVPAYELARKNKPVELKCRSVEIKVFEVVDYQYPHLDVRIVCSEGTYVRSLAHDLGQELGCGAYVSQLRRTRVGRVVIENAWKVETIQQGVGDQEANDQEVSKKDPKSFFVSPRDALENVGTIVLDGQDLIRFQHGNALYDLDAEPLLEDVAVYDAEDRLWGMARWQNEQHILKPLKVFPGGAA